MRRIMELGREHYRAIIFYDFKVGLCEEQCAQRLHLALLIKCHTRLLFLDDLHNFAVVCVLKNMWETFFQFINMPAAELRDQFDYDS